jgi:hypothetical protein
MAKAGGRLFLTDIKFLYFLKRSFPTLFHLIMLLLTRIMDKSLKRES